MKRGLYHTIHEASSELFMGVPMGLERVIASARISWPIMHDVRRSQVATLRCRQDSVGRPGWVQMGQLPVGSRAGWTSVASPDLSQLRWTSSETANLEQCVDGSVLHACKSSRKALFGVKFILLAYWWGDGRPWLFGPSRGVSSSRSVKAAASAC